MSVISFYNLIKNYQIEIPVIQRDYAQGRDNTKASDVRRSIVKSMINSIDTNNKLFLDFIYGRVEPNEDALKKFIPFDGQQRLTTLFLFHKYIFEKCGFDTEVLKNFTYKTRMSSKEFCEKLIQEKIIPSGQESLYDYVKNMSWFYSDWEKDPTIVGMLRMLEEIHTQMKDYDFNDFNKDKLISNESAACSITFELLDMEKNNLSDDTYIKMNSRGKVLTAFENFKASLEEYLNGKDEKLRNDFVANADGTWLEHFWNQINEQKSSSEKKELPDSTMMSFFNRHIKNVWYERMSKEEKDSNKQMYDRIDNELILYPNNDSFISWDIYKFIFEKCNLDQCIKPIFTILNTLRDSKDSILKACQPVWNNGSEWNLYKGDKNNQNTETYPSRVAFYALLKYFEKTASTDNLQDWMRVVWNIIENSTIDSMQTYQSALKLVDKLSEKCADIYEGLASDFGKELKNKSHHYHASEQVKEEIEKIEKFKESEEWEKKIIAAEQYGFFKGLIRFLYINENGVDWNNFDIKWKNIKELVPEEKDKRETIFKLIPYLCDDDIMTVFSDRNLSNSDGNLKQLFADYPNKVHNFLMQDMKKEENLRTLQKDIMLLCNIKKYENYWIHKKWVNDLNVLSNYSVRKWGHFENVSFLIGGDNDNKNKNKSKRDILNEGKVLLQSLNKCITFNNTIHSINGHEIIQGLYINFKYNIDGKIYYFRWQTNGWVDMYNRDWNENLWNEGNHLHSEYSTENGDYKFNDADGLINELKRCIKESQ